jgi:predicted GH43/DUF377 family glycosyl hydrolase
MRRSGNNPLIELKHLPFRSSDIWNAAVVRFEDQILLLITVEMLEGTYRIFRARSDDGERFTVEREPFMTSLETGPNQIHESLGIRDPRVTIVEDTIYITYVADGDHGLRLGLAKTKDFRSIEPVDYVSQVDVKGGALFPRKINGRYALLKRPDAGCSIWVSYSDDLAYWGSERAVMTPRGGYWDPTRIGIGPPPMEIEQGWLLIYYGEKGTSAGPLVRLGAAILDRDDPSKVLARSNIPILSPRDTYERVGNVPNVVFSCGALLEDHHIRLYYGASDSCICQAAAELEDVVRTCMESKKEY